MNELSDTEITRALKPLPLDSDRFDSSVFDQVARQEGEQTHHPLEQLPSWQRRAASLLPLPLLSGGQTLGTTGTTSTLGTGLFGKLIAVAAYPAVAVFVFLGTALFSRKLIEAKSANPSLTEDPGDLRQRTARWSARSLPFGIPIWLAFILAPIFGSGTLVATLLLGSTVILVAVLASLARAKLIHPMVIARVVPAGLLFVAMSFSNYPFVARSEMHFLPPTLLWTLLMGGSVAVSTWAGGRLLRHPEWWSGSGPGWQPRFLKISTTIALLALVIALMAFVAWLRLPKFALPFVRFEVALQEFVDGVELKDNSAHWNDLSHILVSADARGIDVDGTGPRRQLERMTAPAGEVGDHPYIFTSASRAKLLDSVWSEGLAVEARDRLDWLTKETHRTRGVRSLAQYEWSVRSLADRSALSELQIELLESRLRASWPDLTRTDDRAGWDALVEMWMVTDLLSAIGRPFDSNAKKKEVQAWLTKCWTTNSSGFTAGGGFARRPQDIERGPNLESTWYAVQLMKTYGAPSEVDYAWVRSSLQPWNYSFGDRSYLAHLTLRELDAIEGVPALSVFDWLRAERNLIVAWLLLGLCVYVIRLSFRTWERGELGKKSGG